jgi:hypothetical protein
VRETGGKTALSHVTSEDETQRPLPNNTTVCVSYGDTGLLSVCASNSVTLSMVADNKRACNVE